MTKARGEKTLCICINCLILQCRSVRHKVVPPLRATFDFNRLYIHLFTMLRTHSAQNAKEINASRFSNVINVANYRNRKLHYARTHKPYILTITKSAMFWNWNRNCGTLGTQWSKSLFVPWSVFYLRCSRS